MQTPFIDKPFSTTLGGDYLEEPFYFFVGQDGPPDDFTGCTLGGALYQNGVQKLDLTPYLAVTDSPAQVDIAVPEVDFSPLGAGFFNVQLWLTNGGGQLQNLLSYILQVQNP